MRISLNTNLAEIKESRPVPAGKYGLTIASVEEGKSKSGLPQLKVSIGIDGHDDAPNVSHYISLPSAGDEKSAAKALFLARFLALFNIGYDADGFDTDDLPGATATGELTLSEPDDNGNVYNRLNPPRLKDEPSAQGAAAGRVSPKPPKR
jgi:hypothetical protein